MEREFKSVVDQLVREIEGLKTSIGPLMYSTRYHIRFENFVMTQFLEKHGVKSDDPDGKGTFYQIGPEHFSKLGRLERRKNSTLTANALLPSSFLVTLVSRYDAFLGRLIRTMVIACPALLKSSERTLTLNRLLELGDFDTAREFMIEKEIETVLRRSHADHFAWLESRLEIPFRKDLSVWGDFIELTERRNLLVHCDGVVSHQYLANCKEHGFDCQEIQFGEKLDAPSDYFESACDCIIEIAVKLTHVIWRKLLPNERESADGALNETCFDLIVHENYTLARELLRFGNETLKRHASERLRLQLLVNLAQVHKWLDDDDKCTSLLESEDWTAKGIDFQVCHAVLMEDYSKTAELMRSIGKDGQLSAHSYRDWPIFKKARKNEQFQQAYEEVFGETMQIGEQHIPVSIEHLREFMEADGGGIVFLERKEKPAEPDNSDATIESGPEEETSIGEDAASDS